MMISEASGLQDTPTCLKQTAPNEEIWAVRAHFVGPPGMYM